MNVICKDRAVEVNLPSALIVLIRATDDLIHARLERPAYSLTRAVANYCFIALLASVCLYSVQSQVRFLTLTTVADLQLGGPCVIEYSNPRPE